MLIFIKLKIKYQKIFKFLLEAKVFFLIFAAIFVIVFTIFNGRSFYEQARYFLRINIEEGKKFLASLPKPREDLYDIEDSIVIPKININAPIVSPNTTDEKILFNELEKGVVYYPGSALPGKTGNTIILGHSSAYPWYKGNYGSVFSLLNHLDINDEIIVFYDKHKYIYKVEEKTVINKKANIETQNETSRLVLVSCWPVGTAWKRMMVKAVLIY